MQEGSNDYKLEVNSPDELHLLPPHSHNLATRVTKHVGESRKTIISNPVRIRRICPEELMFQRNTVISLGDDAHGDRVGDIGHGVQVGEGVGHGHIHVLVLLFRAGDIGDLHIKGASGRVDSSPDLHFKACRGSGKALESGQCY